MTIARGTVEDLFERSIAAEQAARALYRGFAEQFSHAPEAADYWSDLAEDEESHIEGLKALYAALSPAERQAEADPEAFWKAEELASFSPGERLRAIETLEEAYQLAHDLEYSEVNTVFEFILMTYWNDEERRQFARSQLREHVGKLANPPGKMGNSYWRQSVEARHGTTT
jgi:rubrerythrin